MRNAYWDLAYAIASLDVQRQSLALAQTSLKDTQARIEIGTTAPVDAIEAEAEVATREESVIVAAAQIETAEDALVFGPEGTHPLPRAQTPACSIWCVVIQARSLATRGLAHNARIRTRPP